MPEFTSFFIIIAAGLLFSELFKRIHLPWVAGLIITGMILGPFGLDILVMDDTMQFLSQVGLVFLMFMAGLEIKLSTFQEYRKGVETVALLNGIIPFLVGFGAASMFGYDLQSSLLLGVVFVSSSIAIVIPALEAKKMLETKLGKITVSATMIQDITSLVLLSILLQTTNPAKDIPIWLFYLIIVIALFGFRWAIPRIQKQVFTRVFGLVRRNKVEIFQQELRLVMVMLIGIVLLFEVIGLHPIIAGFFAGLVLSDSVSSERLMDKLHVISYGLFIPIFFVTLGLQTNLGVFADLGPTILLTIAVVFGLILSKFFSGMIGARSIGFSWKQGAFLGAATTPQLSTTLAVVFSASQFGYFDEPLVTAIVILTLVTTIGTPLFMNLLVNRYGAKALHAAQQIKK